MQIYIDVILPIPVEKTFMYYYDEEKQTVEIGMRVCVPFGKNKIYTGIIANIHNNKSELYEPKSIHALLDDKPYVLPQQLKLWNWIGKYYSCSVGEVMKAAIPSIMLPESETLIELNKHDKDLQKTTLSNLEYSIVETLSTQKHLKIKDVAKAIGSRNYFSSVNKLIKKNIVISKEEVRNQFKPKTKKILSLNKRYKNTQQLQNLFDSLEKTPKQKQALMKFFSIKDKNKLNKSELSKQANTSIAVVNSLISKKILIESTIEMPRVQFDEFEEQTTINLSPAQNNAFQNIKMEFKTGKCVLLKGVASSGKTEIYTTLIQEVLDNNKQVLYLLPEIAIATQIVGRLAKSFGKYLHVYHSKYSPSERAEVWNQLLEHPNQPMLIVGTRSSTLLPFSNLGLIIVDEEHELMYKQQEPAPRYHARDVAVVLKHHLKSNLLLGSATPSLESFYNTQVGKYVLVELNERFGNSTPPLIEHIDLKDAHKRKKIKGLFSKQLLDEISITIESAGQVILFCHRRGFSPIIECHSCGSVPECENCDVTLTYHKRQNVLKCHYCGYVVAYQNICFDCGSSEIDALGFGTEQIEFQLQKLLPKARIGRMDSDTTRGKYALQKIMESFEKHEMDVLIGTNMIAKGLHFDNVKLVGIINADSILHFPDFRSSEYAFQLITQVSNRAGRYGYQGKVLIQTYNPKHIVYQHIKKGSYSEFYHTEISQRSNYQYPPFFRIIKIIVRHKNAVLVNRASEWFANALKTIFKEQCLGPEYPSISRIKNTYSKIIFVKIGNDNNFLKQKLMIPKIKQSFHAIPEFRSVRILIDVDTV